MTTKTESTYSVKIYQSGDIEVAKQIIRKNVFEHGLCVTIEPVLFIYTGGEEQGFIVGLINYPRFPDNPENIWNRAIELAYQLLDDTYQHSSLIMDNLKTMWITKREL